jgi:hypothetical protein
MIRVGIHGCPWAHGSRWEEISSVRDARKLALVYHLWEVKKYGFGRIAWTSETFSLVAPVILRKLLLEKDELFGDMIVVRKVILSMFENEVEQECRTSSNFGGGQINWTKTEAHEAAKLRKKRTIIERIEF